MNEAAADVSKPRFCEARDMILRSTLVGETLQILVELQKTRQICSAALATSI